MGVNYYSLYDFTLGRKRDGVYELYVDGEWALDVEHRMEDAFIGITNQVYGLDQYDWNYHKGCLIFEITEEEVEKLKNFREDWTVDCFLVSYIIRIGEDIFFYYLIDNNLKVRGIGIDQKSEEYRYEIQLDEWNNLLKEKNYGTDLYSHTNFLEDYLKKNSFQEFSDYLYVNNTDYLQAFLGRNIAGGIHNFDLDDEDLNSVYEEDEHDDWDEDWPEIPIKERE